MHRLGEAVTEGSDGADQLNQIEQFLWLGAAGIGQRRVAEDEAGELLAVNGLLDEDLTHTGCRPSQ